MLGMYKKPPTVGRIVPSHLFREGYDALSFLQHAALQVLPSYDVPIVLQPWIENMVPRPPSVLVFRALSGDGDDGGGGGRTGHPDRSHKRVDRGGDNVATNDPVSNARDDGDDRSEGNADERFAKLMTASDDRTPSREDLIEVSDALVFAFLVDDHDRMVLKNWLSLQDGPLLVWDQGLAWSHGPLGRGVNGSWSMRILCGPHYWQSNRPAKQACQRICVFHRRTIETLRGMTVSREGGGRASVGASLSDFMQSRDVLAPVFQYAIYGGGTKATKKNCFRFEVDDFFHALDVRIARLLDHVDSCVEKYGNDVVFSL
eukprot:TRINITY_DN2194_c0_g1_i1.p2 TRINITY_DN2194_c0_g1~~TRINITY_DN2194_c0_g1_i1.p2  ORF type:complete len:316 (-),score=61.16 TRINITY_DN2194_c0_g1_i1:24-971(-)